MFHCPYCLQRAVPAPPDAPHPHGLCTACGKSPRAKLTRTADGETLVKYVRDGRQASEPTVTVTVRLYRRQVKKYQDANLSEAVRWALDKCD